MHGDGPPSAVRLRAALAARTRFFDDQVLGAVSSGVGQVVILGAGYDDRALRFPSPGLRYFEIDHPATQTDKVRRLRGLGLDTGTTVFAAADFRADDIDALLAGSGHDAGSPSLFLCEGLLVYLDEATVIRLLGALRARSGPDSTLAASLAVHPDGLDSARWRAGANERRRTADVEPWLTILPVQEHLELLTRAGWNVEVATDASEMEPDAVPDRTLLVTCRA